MIRRVRASGPRRCLLLLECKKSSLSLVLPSPNESTVLVIARPPHALFGSALRCLVNCASSTPCAALFGSGLLRVVACRSALAARAVVLLLRRSRRHLSSVGSFNSK